jgi:hypothetical protein
MNLGGDNDLFILNLVASPKHRKLEPNKSLNKLLNLILNDTFLRLMKNV